MFEGLVASILNKWLGKYVQDLDTEQFNVGIFSGEVKLNNLKLKPEALFELELPIEVKYGMIGEMSLKIPWSSLSSQAISVTIEEVYIVASPVGFDEFDAEKEKKLLRATRKKILDELEGEGLLGSGNGSLLDGLLTALANNIQLYVRKVHTRFEDVSNKIACGICVQGMSIETTNSKWKPWTVPPGSPTVYHLARLEAMTVYFNTGLDKSEFLGPDWRDGMGNSSETFKIQGKSFDYLVKPFSAKLKIIVSRSSEARVPKLLLDLVIQDVVVQLSRAQVHAIIALIHLFRQINLRREFLHIQSLKPVVGNATEWWKYAYKAVVQQRIQPYRWERIKECRDNYRQYKELFKKAALNPGDTELRLDLGRIEDKLSLSSIVVAREHAKIEIKNEDPDRIEIISDEGKWWSLRKSNGIRFQIRPDKPRGLLSQLSQQERLRLNELLGKSEESTVTEKAQKYIEHKINLTLHHFTGSVFVRGNEIASITLAQFLGSFESRPAAQAFKISARAESITIEGASVEHGLVPILTVDNVMGNSSSNFLSIDFEKNPLTVEADYGIMINVEPIEIIYHEHSVSEFLSFFHGIGASDSVVKWFKSLHGRLIRIKSLIDSRQLRVYMNMNLKAPCFVVAETGSLQKAGMVTVFDFGRWTLHSDLQPPLCLEEVTQMELEERLYDRLYINLDGFQMLYSDSGDEWRESLRLDDTEYHILSKVRGQIVLSNSIKPDYKLLPRTKLNISVSSIKLNMSDRRLMMLMDFMDGLPLPSSNTVSVAPIIVPVEYASDMINPEPNGKILKQLKDMVISAELSRQRTPDYTGPMVPSLGTIEAEKMWASIDVSDEDVELWARTVDLPGFDDNVSPNNVIKSLFRVDLGEIVLIMNRSSDLIDKPYLMARISKFRLDAAFMLYGPAIQATLGGVQLIDKLHIGTCGEYLEILTTQSDLDFISLLYRKVRSDCPDFKSYFHSVEQSLVLDIGLLAVTVHREAILTFTKYLQYLYHKIVHKETCFALPKLDRLWSAFTKKEVDDPPIPPGAVKFSYSTNVAEFRLKLSDSEFEFLEFKIGGFESDCMFKANERMVLRAYLSQLSLDDLSEITLYPKLISVDEEKVFEMKYVRHSPRLYNAGGIASSQDDVKSDGSLKLNVGRIHVVLFYKMLIDVQHFIEPLIPTGVLYQVTGLVRRSIALQLHQLRGWNTRLHLSLSFHLPVLLIPQKVSSPNLVLIKLGELSVENFFKEVTGVTSVDESPPVIDNILIKLESAFCSRGLMTLAGSLEAQEEILEPVRVRLDVKRFVGGTAAMVKVKNVGRCRDIPIVDVFGNMEPVKVTLGQKDLSTFLGIWNDNLADGKFFETSWWWRASSPLDIRTPTEGEDPLLRKLQVFLSHGDACRKDTVARFSVDSVVVVLYNDIDEVLSSPVRDLSRGLCRLTLWEATFFLEKNHDSTIDTKIALHSCLLEDIRNDPSVSVKKVFQSHTEGEGKFENTISVSTPPIVDISFKQTQSGDRCIDILVEKTRTNLSVSFLIAIGKFIIESLPAERNEGGFVNHGYVGDIGHQSRMPETKLYRPPSSADSTSGCYSSAFSCTTDDQSGLSVSLQCRKPELMIFSTGERKTRAILFRCEVLADWSRYPGRDNLVVSLANLQAISTSHPSNPRSRQETSAILGHCDAEVVRNVKGVDDGMKVTVTFSPVDIRLSVVNIATLAEIFQELHAAITFDSEKSQNSHNNNNISNEVEDLWSPKKIPTYCDADVCVAVNEPLLSEQQSFPVGKPAESLTFSFPKIRVLVEVDFAGRSKPLFVTYSSLKISAHDWSSLLNLRGELDLQANYYNESLGAWEPFIEPCGANDKNHRPWQLIFQVFQGKSFPISPQIGNKKDSLTRKQEKIHREQNKGEDSETSADESDQGMTFLRRGNFDTTKGFKNQPDSMGYGDSDSENEDGALEKLTNAVGHLFTGDSEGDLSESGASSSSEGDEEQEEEVETEDETASARSTAEERAVFLKKHSDSVDSGLETEAVDRLATHILIHSRDRLELTISPAALAAMKELSVALSSDNPLSLRSANLAGPVINSIGPGATITLLGKIDATQPEKPIYTAKYEKDYSPLSSPGGSVSSSTIDSDADLESLFGAFGSRNGSLSPVLQFPMESLPKLYDRLTENRLLIQVPGFQDLKVVAPKASGNKVHVLHPSRNGTRYHLVLTTEYRFGVRSFTVRGPFQIRNETSYAMSVYYKKNMMEGIGEVVGEAINPFDDMVRLAVVEPDDTLDIPLLVAYHCKLHFLPVHVNSYKISENGLSWQDMVTDGSTSKDLCCTSKEDNDPTVFSLKASCDDVSARLPRLLPNCIVRLVPPLSVHNFLSYAMELKIAHIKYEVRVEAGDKTNIFFLDMLKPQRITFEIPEYSGISWTGALNLTSDLEEKVLIMATEQDTEGGNKQLALCITVKRNPTVNIYVHSPYWIINKTGLPLQLRGSTSDFIYEWAGEGPLLFCYRKQRRRFIRLRAFTSSWSSAFSLDAPGCPGLVICKDRERKRRYRILVKCHLSKLCPELTKIIAFLPNFIVTNDCRKHLRFMEDNERADLWIDIAPGQCLPFWPETDSMRMFVKFRDSKLISQHFPVTVAHVTVLRMDRGCGLTVEVSGGGDQPFSIRFRNYLCGDAPIRIDNQCEDLFLKFHQKELNQVALLSPYQSLLYTWDDPSKERTLVWNVYNNKGKEFCVPLCKDGFGEERVSFHMVRPGKSSVTNSETVAAKLSAGLKKFNPKTQVPDHFCASSSGSDDSDEETQKPQLGKKTRRDKVVVYWASYLDNRQRVLLLTQDERIARRARKAIEAERSHLELFVSINGLGLSLIADDEQGRPRELAYAGLCDSTARWEVMVAHRWKPLAVELAAWLEEKYVHGLNKTQIKDYIHIDFEKMQMTKPFFGELRRRHRPAVWIQYRRSKHMSLLHAQIHRAQVDSGIHDAEFPTILYPVNATRQGCKPALEIAFLKKYSHNCNDVCKFGKIIVREHCVQLERSWLCEMCKLWAFQGREESPSVRIRQDIALVHLPISSIVTRSTTEHSTENMIEYLHCSPIKLHISFSPQNGYEAEDAFMSPLVTYFLSTFASSLTEIKSAVVKLLYFEIIGRPRSKGTIWEEIRNHYKSQLFQQLHVLVMGIDVLANPYSQYLDFNEGCHPCFYEPGMANIEIPEEFSEGLSVGALGFLGHETGGPAGAATLLAASLGTALQRVIHHEDLTKKRSQSSGKSSGEPISLSHSSSNFATVCSLGLSGVVVKPNLGNGLLQGIETFFRGPGKGLMALMSKSSCGVIDCLSMASYGIRRAGEMGDNIVMRMRPPRYVDPILGLRPYSGHDARGLTLLKALCKGHYSKDTYWSHASLAEDSKAILLITLQHIFLVEKSKLWGNYEPIWTIRVDDLLTVPNIENNKLFFSVRQEQNINSFWNEEKSVSSDDGRLLQWLKNQVEMVLVIGMEDKPCA